MPWPSDALALYGASYIRITDRSLVDGKKTIYQRLYADMTGLTICRDTRIRTITGATAPFAKRLRVPLQACLYLTGVCSNGSLNARAVGTALTPGSPTVSYQPERARTVASCRWVTWFDVKSGSLANQAKQLGMREIHRKRQPGATSLTKCTVYTALDLPKESAKLPIESLPWPA